MEKSSEAQNVIKAGDLQSDETSPSKYNTFEYPNHSPPRVKMGFLISITFISALGGFLFGYDTSVVGGVNLYLINDYPDITNFEKEFITSITMIGAAFGSIVGGVLSD